MPRPLTPPLRFRKSSLSVAVSACLLSFGASAIDLAQSPPGTVEPYVRPNVIISIDDSGSMGYRLDKESSTSSSRTTPKEALNKSGFPAKISLCRKNCSAFIRNCAKNSWIFPVMGRFQPPTRADSQFQGATWVCSANSHRRASTRLAKPNRVINWAVFFASPW